MFTGIIKELGIVNKMERRPDGGRLVVSSKLVKSEATIGDSIAINGVCLTVVSLTPGTMSFDISGETLNVTNLGSLKNGERINLEPSLKPVDFIGGHFVSGDRKSVV